MGPQRDDESTATSTSLLRRVRSQDQSSWTSFVRIYAPLILKWTRKTGINETDALDIVQETLIAANTHIEKYRNDGNKNSLRRWLFSITRNKVRDYFRRLPAQPQGRGGTSANLQWQQLDDPFTLDEPESSDNDTDQRELRQRALLDARDQFREDMWQAFWRTAIEQDKPADVAEDLGVSVWFVYKAKSRVLQRLRDNLDMLDV